MVGLPVNAPPSHNGFNNQKMFKNQYNLGCPFWFQVFAIVLLQKLAAKRRNNEEMKTQQEECQD